MLALSTLQYNPIKKNKFLDRKKNIFTDSHAQNYVCTCQKAKKLSKIVEADEELRRQKKWKKNFQQFNHTQPLNCGSKCINRDMNFECSALSCPSMIYCSNRHFQLF